jgi:hypothetical protein
MKLLFTNKNYIVLVAVLGGSIGYFNGLITQMQQLLCSREAAGKISHKFG